LLPVQVGPLDDNPHRVHPTDHAAFLLPVQEALHDYACEPLRRLTALLSWEDPYATTLLYLKVCTITLVLAIVPWAPLMRLIGFAILGPHMALVGHKYYKAAQADQAAERAFEAMSEDERKEKLDTHRQTLLAQHVDALLAEAAALPHDERRTLLARANHVKGKRRLLVPSEVSPANIPPTPASDAHRSSAHYRPVEEDESWLRAGPEASGYQQLPL